MDCVQSILDRDPFEVPGRDFKPQWKMQIDLLDWRRSEELLQYFLVVKCSRGGIQLPGSR